jgi:uncharacterized protein YjbJ (UPF0337 family)
MNKDIAQGKWKQLKGKVREQWGRFTEDDVESLGGSYDRLVGAVQTKYGRAKDEASREVDKFLDAHPDDDGSDSLH